MYEYLWSGRVWGPTHSGRAQISSHASVHICSTLAFPNAGSINALMTSLATRLSLDISMNDMLTICLSGSKSRNSSQDRVALVLPILRHSFRHTRPSHTMPPSSARDMAIRSASRLDGYLQYADHAFGLVLLMKSLASAGCRFFQCQPSACASSAISS